MVLSERLVTIPPDDNLLAVISSTMAMQQRSQHRIMRQRKTGWCPLIDRWHARAA
jgi:hypothetical protein